MEEAVEVVLHEVLIAVLQLQGVFQSHILRILQKVPALDQDIVAVPVDTAAGQVDIAGVVNRRKRLKQIL